MLEMIKLALDEALTTCSEEQVMEQVSAQDLLWILNNERLNLKLTDHTYQKTCGRFNLGIRFYMTRFRNDIL